MDKIFLKGCRFYGYHGVFSEEKQLGQIFTVDLELELDLSRASESDRLEDTVHYGLIFETVKKQVEHQTYDLIEKLGGTICDNILEHFPEVQTVNISIAKENPPIAGHYDAVGISLERGRK